MPLYLLYLLIATLLTVAPASAFGLLGHRIIAALAEDMLTPKAKTAVKALLEPEGAASLASVSTWADDIRKQRPETGPWHYVNIEIDESGYDPAHADTANIVNALNRERAVLAKPDADRSARLEALKWVVHLVGDLHQPLHVGEDHDKGGNLDKVELDGHAFNLHATWDYALLERLHLPEDSLLRMLEWGIASDPAFLKGNAKGTVGEWVDEIHAKARSCYMLRGALMPKGATARLDADYVRTSTLAVLDQLKRAAARLALVLNGALDPASKIAVVSPAAKPPAGWRDDKEAFFRHADPVSAGGAPDAPR